MKVRYTLRAFRQMNAILDYIEDRSPQGARSVKPRLKAAIDLLADHPRSGRSIGKRDLRRIVVYPHPYLIFYRVNPGEIVIHGVRHAARKPRRSKGKAYTNPRE